VGSLRCSLTARSFRPKRSVSFIDDVFLVGHSELVLFFRLCIDVFFRSVPWEIFRIMWLSAFFPARPSAFRGAPPFNPRLFGSAIRCGLPIVRHLGIEEDLLFMIFARLPVATFIVHSYLLKRSFLRLMRPGLSAPLILVPFSTPELRHRDFYHSSFGR